jgi:hypothetical protein
LRFHSPASSTRGANSNFADAASRSTRSKARHIEGASHNATACGSNSATSSRNANSISPRWRTCDVRDCMRRTYDTDETLKRQDFTDYTGRIRPASPRAARRRPHADSHAVRSLL